MTEPLPVVVTIAADFDRDGSYETDLTGYANDLHAGPVVIESGLQPDGTLSPSEFQLALDNTAGVFSPLYGAGSLHGKLGPHVPIRVTAVHNSLSYTAWAGYTWRWRNTYGGPGQLATVQCRDIAAYLFESDPVNLTVATTRDTDAALTAIATYLGLAAGDLDFDDGVQDLPIHFAVGEPAVEAMLAVVDSEMGGLLFVTAAGKLRFLSRGSRLGATPDYTWGDGTNVQAEDVQLELDPDDVVTSVRVRGTKFRTGQADTLVFEVSENMFTRPSATSRALAAGEIYERTFQANSAYVALTTPEAVYDYTANSAIDGTGTDKTSALEVTVTDLGGGRFVLRWRNTDAGTIYVTKFRMRGQPTEFFADRPEASFSKSVAGMKAGQVLELDVPFAGDTGAKLRDYAYALLRTYRYEMPVLTARFAWDHDDTIAAMLAVELGELVEFADQAPGGNAAWATGANDLWRVVHRRHDIVPGGMSSTTLTLVPSYVYRNLDAIAFDTFDRANATGDLGTAFSGDVWADDTGFDISGGYAVPNSTGLQVPNLAVA